MAKADTNEMDFFEKIGYVFSLWNESWEALKLNIWTFVVLYLLPLGLTMVLGVFYLVPFVNQAAGNDTLSAATFAIAFFATLLVAFIYVVLYPVVTLTQLESAQGKKVSLGDVFNRGISYLPAYIVFALIVVGAIAVPLLIAILLIPFVVGILLLPVVFAWSLVVSVFAVLVPYIIINEKLGAVDAVKRSVDVVKAKWQWVLAVYAVYMVISVVANFIPFIGGVVSLAFGIVYFCMPAIVYLRHIADGKAPASHVKQTADTKKVTPKKVAKKKATPKK